MKCIKCGSKVFDNCCIGCGYMTNGNYSNTNKETVSYRYKDLKKYNSSFSEMFNNEKKFIPFILGPLYISYRNHLLFGCLISLIDFLIICLLLFFLDTSFALGLYTSLIISFLIRGFIYSLFANSICLKTDEFEIKRLKNKNIDNHKSSSLFKMLLNLELYIVLFLIVIITGFI